MSQQFFHGDEAGMLFLVMATVGVFVTVVGLKVVLPLARILLEAIREFRRDPAQELEKTKVKVKSLQEQTRIKEAIEARIAEEAARQQTRMVEQAMEDQRKSLLQEQILRTLTHTEPDPPLHKMDEDLMMAPSPVGEDVLRKKTVVECVEIPRGPAPFVCVKIAGIRLEDHLLGVYEVGAGLVVDCSTLWETQHDGHICRKELWGTEPKHRIEGHLIVTYIRMGR